MADNAERELKATIDRVLASESRKKLVVAGPGAGKTALFRKLLEIADGHSRQRLVLTLSTISKQISIAAWATSRRFSPCMGIASTCCIATKISGTA
jgi:hypothetical protein